MSWVAVGGAVAGAVAPSLLGGGDEGGGGGAGQQQTMSKEPWAAAAPWLKQNIQTGQDLQGYYQRNPFNQQQQSAYGNLSAGTGYVNRLVPSLLSQIGNQPGFDRTNPRAKPAGINFAVPGEGLLGMGGQGGQRPDMNVVNNPFANGGIQAPKQQAPAQQPMDGSDDLAYRLWKLDREKDPIYRSQGQTSYELYKNVFAPSSPNFQMNQIRDGF